MKENEIKSIIVKADGNEIKVDHAHELVIGNLTITPKMMREIKSMSTCLFSKDMDDMIDTLINLSCEGNYEDGYIIDKIRAMSCVRDFLMDIEKLRPKD